jgi:16S rRNA (adenine1518-N6/adenine1519-N6)-dimethyltransferase
MLRNNLKGAVDLDKLVQLLEELKINPQSRAEDLSVEQWVNLSNNIMSSHLNGSQGCLRDLLS